MIKNDIAILVLDIPLVFSEIVQPIPLETKWIGVGDVAIATGFGDILGIGLLSDKLQYINLPTISNEYCKHVYRNSKHVVTDDMLCAGEEVGASMCFGDSGGPLVLDGKLIGVISWGTAPCGSGKPDVYTRVSSYVEWILDNTKRSNVTY